jgi:ATP-dependent Clp protease ATP-binding subunit ClpA
MMFERFTAGARQVVVHAKEEARALNHHHIGTEHLLLGLLTPDGGIAYRVLRAAGLSHDRVLGDVKRLVRTLNSEDADALKSIGIDLDAVLDRIKDSFGPAALEENPPTPRRGLPGRRRFRGYSPFAPRSKKVLELSLREAIRLRHNHIGPEHILLGILREGDGLAAKILTDAGVTLADLRRQTLTALDDAA